MTTSTDKRRSPTFAGLLRRISKRYGTVRKFAEALGLEPSRLSRAMNKRNGQPFNVYGCLRLARITGEHPTTVLQAAGKAHIATLIEELYGGSGVSLTEEQKQLLAAHGAIAEAVVRASLIAVAQAAAGLNAPTHTIEPVSAADAFATLDKLHA